MTDLFVSWVLVAEDELPLALVHDVAVFASPSWIHLLRANIFRVEQTVRPLLPQAASILVG